MWSCPVLAGVENGGFCIQSVSRKPPEKTCFSSIGVSRPTVSASIYHVTPKSKLKKYHARRLAFFVFCVSLSLSILLFLVSWYAVGYDRDIVAGPKPVAASIFDEPLVLFRDNSGALQCVSDFCPHRASKLSEGQVGGGWRRRSTGWRTWGGGGPLMSTGCMGKMR